MCIFPQGTKHFLLMRRQTKRAWVRQREEAFVLGSNLGSQTRFQDEGWRTIEAHSSVTGNWDMRAQLGFVWIVLAMKYLVCEIT